VANGFTPAQGTVVIGDTVVSKGFSSSFVREWICTGSGTSRAIATGCDTTAGNATLSNIVDATQLVPGDFLTISGLSGTRRVLSVDYAARTAQLDSTANATLAATAVTNRAPVWEARWNGKVRLGTGTPVTAVTPDAVGMQYQDTAGVALWQATGATANDWIRLT
jgi:hypothetical protein